LPTSTPTPDRERNRKKVIIPLAIGIALLFGILLSQSSFDQPAFLNPDNNLQLLFFASLSALIFLLFVALTFVLARNLLKLFAERRLGVLGSKFRTRLVVTGLLLSFLPVIVMFWFAYGLMNRTIDRWFSRPVEEVREDTQVMASLLATYAQQNAIAEAVSIANSPDAQRAFALHSFASLEIELRRHEHTLQGGFAIALLNGSEAASFREPAPWTTLRSKAALEELSGPAPLPFAWEQTEYILGTSAVGDDGLILVAMPLPAKFSAEVKQLEAEAKAVEARSIPIAVPPPIVIDERPKTMPATIVQEANGRPISVFVSLKENKLYVRQGWKPLFDAPVSFEHPERPIGTHVYTAMGAKAEGGLRWTVVSIPSSYRGAAEAKNSDSGRKGRRERAVKAVEVVAPMPNPSPSAALDRIIMPPELVDRIAEMITPGSSLIVSDNRLSDETGEYTDFIVLTR